MSDQLQIQITKRSPVCLGGELLWLKPGGATLPAPVARVLIDHGHAFEAPRCKGSFADGQCCGMGIPSQCEVEK